MPSSPILIMIVFSFFCDGLESDGEDFPGIDFTGTIVYGFTAMLLFAKVYY